MKLNKKFLMEFFSCFRPCSSKCGSSLMNAAAHPPHPSTIEEEEQSFDSSISCPGGDPYCHAVNYDKKRVELNRSNTILSTSSEHHHQHPQHYWRPSLSVISEDKTTTVATSVQSSVHSRSSSLPQKKLLAGKKHGACRRQRSADSNEYQHNHPLDPMMTAFSPVAAFMF